MTPEAYKRFCFERWIAEELAKSEAREKQNGDRGVDPDPRSSPATYRSEGNQTGSTRHSTNDRASTFCGWLACANDDV